MRVLEAVPSLMEATVPIPIYVGVFMPKGKEKKVEVGSDWVGIGLS